jgi:hypothetical protein
MHGKRNIRNTEHTNIIFKKNKDGSYTKSGLLYQDILRYCIDGKYKENDNKSFRLWNLTKWLLEINVEFINHFKDPSTRNYTIANRIEDRLPRIKGKIEVLVKMGITVQIGSAKESKGSGTVPIFQFTNVGQVIAWIIESMNSNKRDYAITHLYNLFQDNFKNNPSCTDIFNSLYYQKCKEHGLFGDFVDRYRELLESDTPIMNRQGFFQHLLILPKYNIDSNVDFWTLWSDSILQLDSDTKRRFFHHIKLDIERKAEDECHAFAAFERLRFKTRDNPESVTVEGHCKNCGLFVPAAFKLHEYMQMVNKAYPNGVIIITCQNCKKDGSVEFPILI